MSHYPNEGIYPVPMFPRPTPYEYLRDPDPIPERKHENPSKTTGTARDETQIPLALRYKVVEGAKVRNYKFEVGTIVKIDSMGFEVEYDTNTRRYDCCRDLFAAGLERVLR